MYRIKYIYLILVIGIILSLYSCSGINKIVKSKDYNFKFKKANEFYDKGKYANAQTLYQDVIFYFKTTDQYEFIFYRLAYCAYKMRDIYEAQTLFKEYVANFPQSDKVEEMDYMQAFTYVLESPNYNLDPTSTKHAIALLKKFVGDYPNSDKSEEAHKIIKDLTYKLELKDVKAAELYFNAEQYKAASIYYEALVQDYPESMKAEEYKYRSIESLYLYASLSINTKQIERYQAVIDAQQDFLNRFSESVYIAPIQQLTKKAEQYIKLLENELITKN